MQGHPNEKIGFVDSGQKKVDGKTRWDLINADGSQHVHKTTATEAVINTDKMERNLVEVMQELINSIKVMTVALNNARPVSK
jgi:hypothetical protein